MTDYQCVATSSTGSRCIKMVTPHAVHMDKDGRKWWDKDRALYGTDAPPLDVDTIVRVMREHHVSVGVMASPGHWAYRKGPDGKSEWFAHCDRDFWRPETSGCGWSTNPNTYATKAEAWEVAHRHIAEAILGADTRQCVCNVGVQDCPVHPGRLMDKDEKIAFRKQWDEGVKGS